MVDIIANNSLLRKKKKVEALSPVHNRKGYNFRHASIESNNLEKFHIGFNDTIVG